MSEHHTITNLRNRIRSHRSIQPNRIRRHTPQPLPSNQRRRNPSQTTGHHLPRSTRRVPHTRLRCEELQSQPTNRLPRPQFHPSHLEEESHKSLPHSNIQIPLRSTPTWHLMVLRLHRTVPTDPEGDKLGLLWQEQQTGYLRIQLVVKSSQVLLSHISS